MLSYVSLFQRQSLSLQECPTGIVNEETFKVIYAQFFPQGGKSITNFTYYKLHLFCTFSVIHFIPHLLQIL